MVTRTFKFFTFLTLPGLLLTLPASPARAQSVLQQLEREVSDIATKTRAAVVTIEQEPFANSISITSLGEPFDPTRSPTSKDFDLYLLKSELQTATSSLITAVEQLENLRQKYSDKSPVIREKNAVIASLRERFETLKQRLVAKQVQQAKQTNKQKLSVQQGSQAKQLDILIKRAQEFSDALKKPYDEKNHIQLQQFLETLRILKNWDTEQVSKISVQTPDVQKQIDFAKLWQAATLKNLITYPQMARSGTGFSIGEGYIVTTADVLNGMSRPQIVTAEGKRFAGTIVGVYEDLNLGIVKLNDSPKAGDELPALTLGDSETVTTGHFAISVGNLGGQANSAALLMVGSINSIGLSSGSRYYPRLIQIAGTVGEGTSGAPLVDSKGEVIGVIVAVPVQPVSYATVYAPNDPPRTTVQNNLFQMMPGKKIPTYVATPFSSPSTVSAAGFALPINLLKSAIGDIKSGKKVMRAWIGISPEEVTRTHERDGQLVTETSIVVQAVYPNSPASTVGLRPGDLLVAMDGKKIVRAAEIREKSLMLRPGDMLTFTVERPKPDGTRETLSPVLVITARPETVGAPKQ